MKLLNTLLSILLLILLPSLGWSTPFDELVERDGLYYPKFSDVPFTGEITGTSQGSLKNGKKDGDWVSFHSNGQLSSKGNYKNGKKEGIWVTYWSTGQLWHSETHKNGKTEGDWVSYHPNGKVSFKGNYKNGKREGIFFTYNETGGVRFKDTYKDGVKISD